MTVPFVYIFGALSLLLAGYAVWAKQKYVRILKREAAAKEASKAALTTEFIGSVEHVRAHSAPR